MRKFALLPAILLLSLSAVLLAQDLRKEAENLVLRYKELLRPAGKEELAELIDSKKTNSYRLFDTFPFLKLKQNQELIRGKRLLSGKGEKLEIDEVYLRDGGRTFELQRWGPEEFIYFRWKVTADRGEALFKEIVGGVNTYIVPDDKFGRIRESIQREFPKAIIEHGDVRCAEPRLIEEEGLVFVLCEALAYIKDGMYYEDGTVENSFVKFTTKLGEGHLESRIKVLIRGPYETRPHYWYGVNSLSAPATKAERDSIIAEAERTNKFQELAMRLLQKHNIIDHESPSRSKLAEQAGADQPATKPADKVPAKTKPSPPTPKDGPR